MYTINKKLKLSSPPSSPSLLSFHSSLALKPKKIEKIGVTKCTWNLPTIIAGRETISYMNTIRRLNQHVRLAIQIQRVKVPSQEIVQSCPRLSVRLLEAFLNHFRNDLILVHSSISGSRRLIPTCIWTRIASYLTFHFLDRILIESHTFHQALCHLACRDESSS